MCWCNPNIRTPYCGGIICHPSIEQLETTKFLEKCETLYNYCAPDAEKKLRYESLSVGEPYKPLTEQDIRRIVREEMKLCGVMK